MVTSKEKPAKIYWVMPWRLMGGIAQEVHFVAEPGYKKKTKTFLGWVPQPTH